MFFPSVHGVPDLHVPKCILPYARLFLSLPGMEHIEPLFGKTPDELKLICSRNGLPAYTASQMADWLYHKRIRNIDGMTNISKRARAALSDICTVGRIPYSDKAVSSDGTVKYLFPVCGNGRYVETVMIPDGERRTVCVSSQAGCRMGCRFCMTGRQGFHGNLTVTEILSQFFEIDGSEGLTNAVFMGMGEPLDNIDNVLSAISILTSDWGLAWSPKRITVSTIGVNADDGSGISPLRRLLDECQCHVAISLHNPFHEERLELMPMEKPYPLHKTMETIRQYDFTGQRRISFEYTMFAGINDGKRHADALIRLLRGIECRVNLIRFHRIPGSPLSPPPMEVIEAFRTRLTAAGITATLRASRGEDIMAACGMLSGKKHE